MPERVGGVVRRWLSHRRLPWQLALLAMTLCASALSVGWIGDDYFHRAVLTRHDLPMIPHSPKDLFAFIDGDEAVNRQCIAMGILPWWCHEKLRLAFFRPLAGLTHWLDYAFWPQQPWLMHLQSLVWFGVAVVAVAFLYRCLFSGTWIAGLAALLYAIDDARGLPAVWLANRNALMGVCFGVLALIAHTKWRRDGVRAGAVLAPIMLLLGLLSKESTVAVGAYLLAYAVFLDRGTWARRAALLLPCLSVGVVWWAVYNTLGYGAGGSGWYVNPLADPFRFAELAVERAPVLMAWQWLVPSDLEWSISPSTAHALSLATLGTLMVLALAVLPLLRRNALARFWAMGMTLSLLPACTAYPSGRLLFFVGIGGMGLLAQLVGSAVDASKRRSWPSWRRVPTRIMCAVLLALHLGVAPVALANTAANHKRWGTIAAHAAESLPAGPSSMLQTTIIVNTPAYAVYSYAVLMRLLSDNPYMSRTLVLGSGEAPIEATRTGERTLLVCLGRSFLAPETSRRPVGEMQQILFDQRCQFPALDRLYRDHSSMTSGQRINLVGASAEIITVTDDGRPAEVAFHFAFNLDSRLFRWLQWEDGAFVPFTAPIAGQSVTLPPARAPF